MVWIENSSHLWHRRRLLSLSLPKLCPCPWFWPENPWRRDYFFMAVKGLRTMCLSVVFVVGRPRSCVRRCVDVSAARTTRTASSARRWCTWPMRPRSESYNKWQPTPNCQHPWSIGRQTVPRPVSWGDGMTDLIVSSVGWVRHIVQW